MSCSSAWLVGRQDAEELLFQEQEKGLGTERPKGKEQTGGGKERRCPKFEFRPGTPTVP